MTSAYIINVSADKSNDSLSIHPNLADTGIRL